MVPGVSREQAKHRANPAGDSAVKYRAKSVQVPAGGTFSFPFESPGAGCVVRYAFQVHGGYEASFEFRHGGVLLHEARGEACEAEVTIPAAGMCEACWSNSWLSFATIAVSYEVVLTPAEHRAAVRVRRLLQLARSGDIAELRAGLATTPVDARYAAHDYIPDPSPMDELGLTALHAAASYWPHV